MDKDGGGAGRRAGPRTVALVGPMGTGKTTLLEAILARTGAVQRQGAVEDGTALGDGSAEARAHGMSVALNIAETRFMDEPIALVDAPGSIEFWSAAEAALPAVDLAIVVVEADARKIPALQVILKRLETLGIPRLLFLNKIDRTEIGVRAALSLLQTASTVPLVARHIPIRQHDVVTGFIDLALERAFIYREHATALEVDMTDEDRAREVEARFQMLETLADYDDVLMEELLEDVQPSRETVFADMMRETRQGLVVPVMIGSALHGNGVHRLLKAIRHDAPDIAETGVRLGVEAGEDAVVQIVGTIHTGHAGKLSIGRVLAGRLGETAELVGPDGPAGRASGLVRILGGQTVRRGAALPGELVGLSKVEGARTGMTLSTGRSAPRQIAPFAPPAPAIEIAIAPLERKDDVKLSAALAKLVEEDPGLTLRQAEETGETILGGQGEMHLRVATERLAGRFGLAIETREPAIRYRETIRGAASVRGRHKKQSGGHGQYGDCALEIRPLPRGSGFRFEDAITGGVVPRNYIPAIEAGAADALKAGPLGFPVVDVAVRLVDGSYHSVDSSDQAFRMAAQIGMREGLEACGAVLLEPVLRVGIAAPSEATPRINTLVTQRRGQILGFDVREGWPGWDVVEALIPEAEMRGLIVELRSVTAGVGSYVARFDHLAELAGRLAEQAAERARRQAA
ncbi:elongation factor G [Prosthecomicrobium pneumaticum]|uniref:Elongation factor G n=1 Tax=Prosthecomicrobium pneumaticum TaxID=81895 RepID=A0A7W9FLE7_9HYPH|nr:elongation factor G [Prosthecomicrobium pneumaticum]MBB5752817.1 elongation factor G [Prosthecomicrobium pneumaticum]